MKRQGTSNVQDLENEALQKAIDTVVKKFTEGATLDEVSDLHLAIAHLLHARRSLPCARNTRRSFLMLSRN
jgi:hypothetical protein